jgi:aminoglycoside phosphotransferase (APT) family kinase protein
VLDCEFTHRGSPFEDMGWLSVRDWRFGVLDKPVGGLCDRARFYAAYEAAGGIAVNPESVHFWEVFGNMSWATGALWQTQRYLDGEYDFELLAIGRRTAEMTYEALRLIERGVWQ